MFQTTEEVLLGIRFRLKNAKVVFIQISGGIVFLLQKVHSSGIKFWKRFCKILCGCDFFSDFLEHIFDGFGERELRSVFPVFSCGRIVNGIGP